MTKCVEALSPDETFEEKSDMQRIDVGGSSRTVAVYSGLW